MRKLNVAVLYGGKSSERDISILTGTQVSKELDREKYQVFPIEIGTDGISWKYKNTPTSDYPKLLKKLKIDLVFIALHGPFGEDGTVQGLLELMCFDYTGSGVLASSIGMNKIASRRILKNAGLKVPDFSVHKISEPLPGISKPVFVQTDNQGSSIGASIARDSKELKNSLDLAHRYTKNALVDEFINGTEITCAILGNDKPKALPVVEIVPKHDFFDYECKYDPKLVDEICPARISPKLRKKAQELALAAYKAVGCRVFGRVDQIIKNNEIYTFEVNTIPGLTPVSLLPKAAMTAGIPYSQLLDEIIYYSLNDK